MIAPGLRKAALVAHVASSVGWIGAVITSLALGVAGLVRQEAQIVRAAYLTMELTGWWVLVPMSFASLLTGLVVSLGGKWGLLRHYWVAVKLVMNVVATVVLLLYMRTLGVLADLASDTTGSSSSLSRLRSPSPVIHAGGALLLLLAATTLSVYKPAGLTRHGQRHQLKRHAARRRPSTPPVVAGHPRETSDL